MTHDLLPLVANGQLFDWIHFLAVVDHSFAINLCFAIRFKICIKRFLNGTMNLL